MSADIHILRQSLCDPARTERLTEIEWDLLLRQSRRAGLAARLWHVMGEAGCREGAPAAIQRHLESALFVAQRRHEALRWEIACIVEALQAVDTPVVFLKGAAYVAAGLPVAAGRIFSDMDILVPKEKIQAVEAALMQHGWAPMKINAYDQRYYRQWMHEIPPLEHVRRQSVIDVHHNILPLTARYHPDARLLLESSLPCALNPRARVLAPCDMVLHCATHLFHEGESDRALRDLIDFDSLLRSFATDPTFWDRLLPRAQQLELSRPLFYGLRYASRLLGTPIPAAARFVIEHDKPAAPIRFAMDWLAAQGFRSKHASCADAVTPLAHFVLYLRGHWLRMPPWLLIRHLLHKAFVSPRDKAA